MRTVITLIALLAVVVAGILWANRPVTITISAGLPDEFPADGFSHRTFEALLQEYVNSSGDVDYDIWHASQQSLDQLNSYLAAVAAYSPDSTPDRFDTRTDELAYWMYGYNAYVISGVLSNWPINSVTDVKAPIEAVKGLGFFYRNRYIFGGKAYSLLHVENEKIRARFKDPRIHFVLNCASESCPVLRPELPTGNELELLLADATQKFVSEPRNVFIDHDKKVIRLSAIFKMYREDFINHVRASGRPVSNGVLTYILDVAPDRLRSEIEKARDYEIEFSDFDWSLNNSDALEKA
ncbi:MAG: DUF547 domain-containing protein [Gammaproteobacteria bacterium]|nr:DUF547 domain-containing protein [Gammaproteobacteria bacterium]